MKQMLNESWQLCRVLENANIEIDISHPLINPLPASEGNLLRVRLNNEGHVVSVEDIYDDERRGLWRIINTSDGSFPVLKVNQPLIILPEDSILWNELGRKNKESKQIDLLSKAIADGTYRSWTEAGWNWSVSLEKADLLVKSLSESEHGESIVSLACRFQKALQSDNIFVSEICTGALTRIWTNRLNAIKTVQELLIGKGKDKYGKNKKISVLIVLELDKGGSVYRNEVRQSVADILPTNLSATKREHSHCSTESAFIGNGALLKEPFPQVKLPVLNSTFPLMSMASDADKAKCNKRYGLTGYTIFPVTLAQSMLMKGAIEWLVSRNEGTTWRGVPSGKFDKKKEKQDLLIVYVDKKPELDAKTASFFGSGPEIAEAQFEVDAKAVSDALNCVVQEYPNSKLNLFLIRKVSEGQIQIVLTEFPKVKDVLLRARNWQQAVWNNIPKISLYLPSGRDFKKNVIPEIMNARPIVPYPDQVVRLLSNQWLRDGSKQEVVGAGLGEVLNLMLRVEGKWELSARKILNLLILRLSPLLIGVFGAKHAYSKKQCKHGKHKPVYTYPRESRRNALQAVAMFGILLDALGFRKEKYMKDAPYQVGQILALADTLHKDYCIVVRKGQLPNSLIGTSLMRRALDSPAGALADLSERIIEYVRWAKVTQIAHDWPQDDQRIIAVNEARKKLRQYEALAESVAACTLPTECNDVMKAQLLLGFLASAPDEEQNN
jgi:hypothetical protein